MTAGVLIEEFVGLRSKNVLDTFIERRIFKKSKGVKGNVSENNIIHENYV